MNDAFLLFFKGLARHAPGTDEATLRALAACQPRPDAPKIADLGSGTGASALVLLETLPQASVLAVDRLDTSLQTLRERAERRGVDAGLSIHVGDALALTQGPFDILWSEGAIYAMGWSEAFAAWLPQLAPGGFIVVSDAVWTQQTNVPPEATAYWAAEYPAMATAAARIALAEDMGLTRIVDFAMPREGWDLYYGPLEQRVALVENNGRPSADMLAVARETAKEIAMYRTHGDAWNYHYFVFQR